MLCLLFITMSQLSVGAATPKTNVQKEPNLKIVSLFDYLSSVSLRLGCYYTIEIEVSSTGSTILDGLNVTDNRRVTNTRELAADLSRELPSIVVIRDEEDPHVIHLVAASLKDRPGYPLNRRTSIAYKGRLTQLPDKLGEQLHTELYTQRVFATPFVSFDYRTRIDFTAKDEQVRSILSNHVPLVGYDRFMWLAETYVTGGKTVTTVDYKGIVKKK